MLAFQKVKKRDYSAVTVIASRGAEKTLQSLSHHKLHVWKHFSNIMITLEVVGVDKTVKLYRPLCNELSGIDWKIHISWPHTLGLFIVFGKVIFVSSFVIIYSFFSDPSSHLIRDSKPQTSTSFGTFCSTS